MVLEGSEVRMWADSNGRVESYGANNEFFGLSLYGTGRMVGGGEGYF